MLPALPLDEAGKYVAGAYLIFLALLFIYVSIMASKLSKIEREVVEIAELVENRPQAAEADTRVKAPV
ncbi:MAG: hypothetical protein QOD83_1056 [Solirubrobacteraceae bacterium]|jgi:hypothetical protein|nr:hypothetical protein [Solirubrobacteraceae bacterium]MEA2185074.1 hypothetical protein [Solirubrobacteraceae bacterium]MEA2231240.1 hypothetical protein [Solirubrobacteraceae bacterium]